MSKKQFLVSAVMPVCNNEEFLEEAVNSLTAQTLGFENNIQLILINCGNSDKFKNICDGFQKKYPDNIIYLSQESNNISSARNLGMKSVSAKYVNFMNSRDKWENNAFQILYDFMEKNNEKTDAAAARKSLFDGGKGWHGLDYKFNKTITADLDKQFDLVQNDVSSVLFTTDALKNLQFCEDIDSGEETRFVNEVLFQKCSLGIVREAVYFSRVRTDENSQTNPDSYYFDIPVHLHQYLFSLSKQKYGSIKKFIQYTIMYDLTWRLKRPAYKILDEQKFLKYSSLIRDLMKDIDDDVIYRQRNIYMNMKMYAFSLKYGSDARKNLELSDNKIMYKNFTAMDISKAQTLLIWDYFEIKNNVLRLEGKDNCWLCREDFSYYAEVNGELYYPSYYDCKKFDLVTMDGISNKGRAVVFELRLCRDRETTVRFFHTFKGKSNEISTSTGKFSHLADIENAYYAKDDVIIKRHEKGFISYPNTPELRAKFEQEFCNVLTKEGKKNIIELRKTYFERIAKKKKNIWLISDRPYVANDNGEFFFRYMNRTFHKNTETFFNINQDCPDFQRMKKYGKVIPYDTDEYNIYFLLADKIISSAASDYVFNPFGSDRKYLTDIINSDFVFLQHGITKDDISSWINRMNKNIRLVITSAMPEYLSILNGDYYMKEDNIALTGMARYDNLFRKNKHHKPMKKIVIIPTWRQSIKGSYNPKTSESIYYDKFRDTDYFKFYNSLINDKRLLEAMELHGYTGLLCMHPLHSQQYKDFDENSLFKVNQGLVDYQKEFTEASLLITDYSSVAFDFAYLKKPVIYAQFDKDDFYSKHTYKKGYFSYEENGFGCICADLDSTVSAVIAELENGCKNTPKYLERIQQFFPHTDAHCCKRIYQSIKKLDRGSL